jgi:phosphate transport system protein
MTSATLSAPFTMTDIVPPFRGQGQESDIRISLLRMAECTEQALGAAIEAFFSNDGLAARNVLDRDRVIDVLEVRNDTLIYQHIALHQPEQAALRMLLSSQKVNTILERVGDHAVNIAESALALKSLPDAALVSTLREMSQKAVHLLNAARETFFGQEAEAAEGLLRLDDEVDSLNRLVSDMVRSRVFEHNLSLDDALEIIHVSKNLERVADLATNIAEETVFSVKARSVKHRGVSPDGTPAGPVVS